MSKKLREIVVGVVSGLLVLGVVIAADQITNMKTMADEPEVVTEDAITYTPMDEVETIAKKPQAKKKKKTTYEKNLKKYGLEDADDLKFFAKCVFQEVRGTTYECKRLVVDVILNRADQRKDKSVRNVITARGQFSVYPSMMESTPSYKNMSDTDKKAWTDTMRAIKGELARKKSDRASDEVLYFRSGHYHNFGTPIVHEGSEYFSK